MGPVANPPSKPHVAIIGAGPAGSIAAILLGRSGFDVTLIEQHAFPRDKVCGECLSALGIGVLSSAGLADEIYSRTNPAVLTHSVFYAPDGSQNAVRLPKPMWGISRAQLDRNLLESAAQYCSVEQPARCERLDAANGTATVWIRRLGANQVLSIQVDWVLLADGKAALMPRKPTPTDDFGLKSHWQGVDAPSDCIELFGVDGHYGGVAPIENELFNLSFSVPAARLRAFRGDHDALFAAICNENVALRRQFNGARRDGRWLAAPLPRHPVMRDWPARVIPLGAAAAALEPIGGEGMGLAMRSAQTTAEELIAAMASGRPVNVERIRRQFQSLWQTRSLACRLAARVISRPPWAAPAIDLLNCAPAAAGLVMRLIGK